MSRQWPMRSGDYTLTSGFGPRWGTHHSGLDFGAPDGTPFYACADGTVTHIGSATGYGQWIVIDHPANVGGGCTEYGHMWNAFATGLSVGSKVTKGQLIGYVGSNGQSTGPHLHLTVWEYGYGGRRIDPEVWLKDAPHPGEVTTAQKEDDVLFGIDVSEHQDNFNLRDAVNNAGLDFVILRTNDGTYKDRLFHSHLEDVERSDALVSVYWYLRAPSEGTTIAQQVDTVVDQLRGRTDLGVWIDVESVAGSRKLLIGDDVWAAKRELESRGLHVPGVYTGRWYWEHMPGGEPSMDGLGRLWVSDYGQVDRSGAPAAIYNASGGDSHRGWSYPLGDRLPDLLQIGSRGVINGHAPVDVNVFRGDRDQLANIFHPSKGHTMSDDELKEIKRTTGRILDILEQRTPSLINDEKSFNLTSYTVLGDRMLWELVHMVAALCEERKIDPHELIAEAIEADRDDNHG